MCDGSCTLQDIPRFFLCFWLSVAQLWMLAVRATDRGHLPLGGPIKSCAPHKNFILHVPGSWVASQQGWHDGERSIHKEKLNRFDDVPDHLCVCGQTSKKILVEMRSVSAVHLEMFLSGSSLSGFSPHFVLSLSCPRSCYSSALHAGGLSRFVLLHCSERLKNLEEMLNRFFFFFFFFSPSRSVWRMRTVGIDMICFIFWEALAVTTTK